jgi:hypothetical protein
MIGTISAWISVIATGVFAGGALMQSIVDHPARESTEPAAAIGQMQATLKFADPYMPILVLLGSVSMMVTYFCHHRTWHIAADALLLFLIIPFTLIFILPVNKKMLALSGAAPEHPAIRSLMRRWGRLHAVRSILGFAALIVIVFQLV